MERQKNCAVSSSAEEVAAKALYVIFNTVVGSVGLNRMELPIVEIGARYLTLQKNRDMSKSRDNNKRSRSMPFHSQRRRTR